MKQYLFSVFLLVLLSVSTFSQDIRLNKYGLYVIDDPAEYGALVEMDSSKLMVNLEDFIPGIKTEVKYASTENFMKKVLYPEAKTYLRLPAAEALKNVQKELKEHNLELKIFDAYRPYSVTVDMYETYGDTNYVSSAWKGSRHNRGCAVDLIVINSETGKELEMPTPYDDFTEKAHADYMELSKKVLENREMLISIMEYYGFRVFPTEWWHFDFNGWENYELLDLSFNELEKTE